MGLGYNPILSIDEIFEWDWDTIANEWEQENLDDWGLDVWQQPVEVDYLMLDDEHYTKKIDAPEYEPKGDKPESEELFNEEKTKLLIEKISSSNISKKEKLFLTKAAQRHIIFN